MDERSICAWILMTHVVWYKNKTKTIAMAPLHAPTLISAAKHLSPEKIRNAVSKAWLKADKNLSEYKELVMQVALTFGIANYLKLSDVPECLTYKFAVNDIKDADHELLLACESLYNRPMHVSYEQHCFDIANILLNHRLS